MKPSPDDLQKAHFSACASNYDRFHDGDEHTVAANLVLEFVHMQSYGELLDVGCGTGRILKQMRRANHRIRLCGIEPNEALIKAGQTDDTSVEIIRGSGTRLPFRDRSFDAVCAFALLHHVPDAERVVAEMARVARRAVFISDFNRYGNGSLAARLAKVALQIAGLLEFAMRLKTRGKGYFYSDGDGIAYAYSVLDSYATLAAGSELIFVIPTKTGYAGTFLDSLIGYSHGLLCAMKTMPSQCRVSEI